MSPLLATFLIVAGLVLLTGGGEALVRGATALARLSGLSPAVIGLTVVALGTSLPELVVSVLSAMRGTPDLAVGNVVGSNIFNITATLGGVALVTALPVRGNVIRLEWPVMFIASLLCVVLLRDSRIDRVEAGFLLASLVAFTAYAVHIARVEASEAEHAEFAEAVAARTLRPAWRDSGKAAAFVVGGIVLLIVGGRLLVDGAVGIARWAGMTDRVIGLTVVAVGTGVPEVATSLIAALRRQTDIAVANMIGSNIFNILGILGVTGLIAPLEVSADMAHSDMYWMVGTSLLLFPLLRSGLRLTRLEGAALVAVYVVYVVQLLR